MQVYSYINYFQILNGKNIEVHCFVVFDIELNRIEFIFSPNKYKSPNYICVSPTCPKVFLSDHAQGGGT